MGVNCGDRKPRPTVSGQVGLAVLANLLRLLLWFSCDRNLNVSTLFELHIIAMFVS
jgi:hypothetical protein